MKLVTRIAIIITLVAVPSAIIAFSVVYNLLRNEIINPSKNDQLTLTKNNLNTVDRFLEEREVSVQVLGSSQLVLNLANDTNQQNRQSVERSLVSFVEGTGYWDSVSVVNDTGQILASNANDTTEIGQIFLQHPEAINKALTGEVAYSEDFVDPSGERTMIFAAPVEGAQSAIVGMINWQSIEEVLASLPGNLINLFNKDGEPIGTSKSGINIMPLAITQAKEGQSGVSVETIDNQEAIISYSSETGYKEYTGNKWIMTILRPASEVYSVAERLPRAIIVAFSLSTLGVMLLITLFIARLLKPVINMTKTANKIALGDLTQRVAISSNDEFGSLAKAFNNMADRLQLIYKNLENKVQERTTQLAQKVDEVERERAKDEAILSSIGEGMIVVNADETIAIMNRAAATMLNLDTSLIGKSVTNAMKLLTQADVPVVGNESPAALALQTGQMTEGIYKISDNDVKRQIAIIANPIIQDRKIIGAIMIFRDVTKEREIDRMKTEFISLASHQLRTPLSAIKWFSEMLIGGDAGKLNPEQAEFSKNIYDSTERMIELVNSLLNISRIESGRIIVDPKPTDLKELVNGIVNDLRGKIEGKQQNLIISVHEDLGKINLDPRLIGQVYLNFLTNAIKYTPKGGEISVFISRKGDEVVSQITDNGYGIPKSQHDRVFNKFFRAENIVKVETEGTGLGLYLVKAIIESSGGKVWFKSEEGKGTTFWFSLPITGMKARAGEVSLDA